MSKVPHTIVGCGVAVVRDGKILLAQRIHPDKPGYGLWAMPGGTIDEGEWPAEAAEREVEEETGLSVVTLEALPFWHWTDKWNPEHPWLTLYFHATVGAGEPVQTEPEKQGPWGWYAPDKLPFPLWHGITESCEALGLL